MHNSAVHNDESEMRLQRNCWVNDMRLLLCQDFAVYPSDVVGR